MASSMTQPYHYYSTQHMHVQVYRDQLQWSVRTYKAGVLTSPLPVEYNVVNPIVLPNWPNGAYSRTSSTACIAACPSTGWKLSGQLAWWHEGNFCEARVVRPIFCFMGCLLFMYTTRTFQSCDTIISVATFPHVAHSVAMIYRATNVVKAVVTHLHPEQAPVIVADQPMYSLAKKLQWNFPATHGEDKYVVFLGGMHVELTVDKCLGNWLEGSGWTTTVTNSGIASGGTADSFLKTSHLGRTKHAYQLTAVVLYTLVDHAHVLYKGRAPDDEVVDFTIWKEKLSDEQPQFAYWCWSYG